MYLAQCHLFAAAAALERNVRIYTCHNRENRYGHKQQCQFTEELHESQIGEPRIVKATYWHIVHVIGHCLAVHCLYYILAAARLTVLREYYMFPSGMILNYPVDLAVHYPVCRCIVIVCCISIVLESLCIANERIAALVVELADNFIGQGFEAPLRAQALCLLGAHVNSCCVTSVVGRTILKNLYTQIIEELLIGDGIGIIVPVPLVFRFYIVHHKPGIQGRRCGVYQICAAYVTDSTCLHEPVFKIGNIGNYLPVTVHHQCTTVGRRVIGQHGRLLPVIVADYIEKP